MTLDEEKMWYPYLDRGESYKLSGKRSKVKRKIEFGFVPTKKDKK